jgi:hypothetical protein
MQNPKMTVVTNSSNVTGFAHVQGEIGFELIVEFKGGARYSYKAVPVELFDKLKAYRDEGGSVGKFINAEVKPKHLCVKLEDSEDGSKTS